MKYPSHSSHEPQVVGTATVNIGHVAQESFNKGNLKGRPRPSRQRRHAGLGHGLCDGPSATDSSESNEHSQTASTKATTPALSPAEWWKQQDPPGWKQNNKDKEPTPAKAHNFNSDQKPAGGWLSQAAVPQRGTNGRPAVRDHNGNDVRGRRDGPPRTKEQLARLKSLCDATWDAVDERGRQLEVVDFLRDSRLADWDGNMAPPPVDWDSRAAFRPYQSEVNIQAYVNSSCSFTQDAVEIINKSIRSDTEGKHEVALLIWKPEQNRIWDEVIEFTNSLPDSEDDLKPTVPFWRKMQYGCDVLQPPHEHPPIVGVDSDENDDERVARENDLGSNGHIEDITRIQRAKKSAERQRRQEERMRQEEKKAAATSAATARNVVPDFATLNTNQIKLKTKVFLRAARDADVPEIRKIYNHYVANTSAVPEVNELSNPKMLSRLQKVKEAHLPFIVACEKGQILRGKKKSGAEPIFLPDKILGFAFATPFPTNFATDTEVDVEPNTPPTAYVNIFTEATHLAQGIGSCLLDKYLDVLDRSFLARGGYDVRGDEVNGVGVKVLRVKSVVIRFLHVDEKRLAWATRWFESPHVGFKKVEVLKGAGTKNGKSIDEAIFKRETSEQFDNWKF